MLVILTILTVSVTDLMSLANARLALRVVRYAQLVWWVLVTLGAMLWIRPDAWVGAVAALVAVVWYFLAERLDAAEQPGLVSELYGWSAIGLVALLAGFAWLDVAVLGANVPAGLLWLALAVFLTQTGNRITRCVLLLSGRVIPQDGVATGAVPNSSLKGGRVIGPLERLFITVLAVVGAFHVVAALMAAKGIVRFPEISADAKREDSTGTTAEEFLVGSLASWGLAGGAGLLAGVLLP